MRVRGGNGIKIRVRKHMTSRGVWGHAPPENFCILDSLRLLLMHSQVPIGKYTVSNNNQSIDYADQWC